MPGARAEGTSGFSAVMIPQYAAVGIHARLYDLSPRKRKI